MFNRSLIPYHGSGNWSSLGCIKPAGVLNLAHTVAKKSKRLKLGAFPLKCGYLAIFERSEDLATPDLSTHGYHSWS